MSGMDHIQAAFQRSRELGRAAVMPYFTLGYPTQPTSLAVVQALAQAGADIIELGMPFSDPLADGPTIQHSTHIALQQGMTLRRCLDMVRSLRDSGLRQPLLLMGYINPLLSYGIDIFIREAAQAGADGLILPDLPVEEAGQVEHRCRKEGLALVYLLAPTSTTERIRLLSRHASGFLYLVSVTGVTGARSRVPTDLAEFVSGVRRYSSLPLAVGFGISTPAQAAEVGRLVDGVIVGSALINAIEQAENPSGAAADFLTGLLRGMEKRA